LKVLWKVILLFLIFNFAADYRPVIEEAAKNLDDGYGFLMEGAGMITGRWVNRHGFYYPDGAGFDFVSWRAMAVYVTLLILVCLLRRGEREIAALKNELKNEQGLREMDEIARKYSDDSRDDVYAAAMAAGTRPDALLYREPTPEAPKEKRARRAGNTRAGGSVKKRLNTSIVTNQPVTFSYIDRDGVGTFRPVRPLRVYEDGGRWYLEAYCFLRMEERTFRLDRMEDVKPMVADAVKEYGEGALM